MTLRRLPMYQGGLNLQSRMLTAGGVQTTLFS